MSRRILICGGHIIDPAQGIDGIADLLIEDGKIVSIGGNAGADAVRVDAKGQLVVPGLVDLGTQLREPGHEEDETILSGTAAALAGGFTSIACLPETEPPIDTPAAVEFVRQKAARARNCNVFVLASISKNREGKELSEIGSLVEAGAVGFSDACRPLVNSELLRRALEYCLMFDKPILCHPEVPELSRSGVMHEGLVSLVLGLASMPSEAEDVMVSRDVRLAESTGGRLHLLGVSSRESCDILRRARDRKVKITAGINPNNFSLTDEVLRSFDSHFKVNPPFRSQKHVDACIAALRDGVIEVISSGHSPRASEKTLQELDLAPFGVSSLETTVGMVGKYLVQPGHLTWMQAIEKLSLNPARLLGLNKGTLLPDADADITLIDPAISWQVNRTKFRSKSCNTPYGDLTLQGKVTQVFVAGEAKL